MVGLPVEIEIRLVLRGAFVDFRNLDRPAEVRTKVVLVVRRTLIATWLRRGTWIGVPRLRV